MVVAPPAPAAAQVIGGEFSLRQEGNLVGWVACSGDRSTEWWAYIEGQYVWADSTHVPGNEWALNADFRGPNVWTSYAEWKASVLQRPATQGRRVTFQRHTVVEETIQN